jgi:hypothetical protein
MLGRVFESLLATQITATGEQARKAKGAYYTPREIVAYMCKESLRQYLYTGLNNRTLNGGIDSLLDKHDAEFETAHTNAKRDLWGNENSEKVSLDVIALLDKIKILDPACGSGAFPLGMVQLLEKVYERLEPRFDRYKTKLQVIQNNIYGVDIEPMAVEISRLRAWLSIVVDEEDSRNIKPLPNLDFKFVQGNSLLQIDSGDLWNSVTLEQLEKLKNMHFRTHVGEDKKGLTRQINTILNSFSKNGIFDFKVWFSEVFKQGGFDIVIGNPPYVSTRNFDSLLKDAYKKTYELAVGQFDLFILFIERANQLLNINGLLSFIIPKKILTNENFMTARRFLLKYLPIKMYLDAQMPFESASVEANVIISSRVNVKQIRTYLLDGNEITAKFLVNTELISLMPFNIFPFAVNPSNIAVINSIHQQAKHILGDYLVSVKSNRSAFYIPGE